MIGVGIAVWAPLVPDAKARLGLDDGQLGTLLLGLGIGGLVALPLAGPLVQARGARAVMLGAGLLFCALLPGLAVAPGAVWLAGALVLLGACTGAVDIAMNAQAAAVERATGRTLMSGFHGAMSKWRREFLEDRNRRSHKFYRVANEVPTVLLVVIVVMVIVKPF